MVITTLQEVHICFLDKTNHTSDHIMTVIKYTTHWLAQMKRSRKHNIAARNSDAIVSFLPMISTIAKVTNTPKQSRCKQ